MNGVEKHLKTKLNIEVYQVACFLRCCNDFEKQRIIASINDDLIEDEHKLPISVEDIRNLFGELSDKERLEVIKSLIWTSLDNHSFHQMVKDRICVDKFEETLD